MTYDLFAESDERSDTGSRIELPDGEVLLFASLFSPSEATRLFARLRRDVLWQQEKIQLYGKVHNLPRLTAWYGDPNTVYRYSGITVESRPWMPDLLMIKQRIERVSSARFNSVLLNLYRDGSDSMSWHADDEPELGLNPTLGSVSFGQDRVLQMKHKKNQSSRRDIRLANGSFLLMRGVLQHHWLHQVAKSKRQMGERINLTYRYIL